MKQTDDGEIRMSRREYSQLMAAVPASHATSDDDGFFSGLFGSSSEDAGPGLLEDMEIRHEDEHVIMDPEVIDFMGASLEVERPNDYDNAVRIRVAGDVAVEGEHIEPESVGTDDLSSDSTPASYHVYTDGTDIWAVPQQNPFDDITLETVTGTDIGVVDDEIRINQLPPQGEPLEANGRVFYKRGEYPGDLANGEFDGMALVSGMVREGETVTHHDPDQNADTIPTTTSPTHFTTSSRGLATPDVNGEFMIYPMVRNMLIEGPGAGDNGSIGIDDNNQNNFDWGIFENVAIQKFDVPIDSRNDSMITLRNCQFRKFAGKGFVAQRANLYHTTFQLPDGAQMEFRKCNYQGGGLHAVGESSTAFTLGDGARLSGVRLEKLLGTDGSGTFILGAGDFTLKNCHVATSEKWSKLIFANKGSPVVEGITGLDSMEFVQFNGTVDARFAGPVGGGFSNVSNATRPRYEGTIGGGPLGGVDAAPSSPSLNDEAVATASWDPDGDGNGEKVIYDGTAWQEVADMPNL